MSDLISRRSALEALTVTEEMDTAELLWLLTTRINDLPSIQPEPTVIGKFPVVTLDTVFKNEASNINTASYDRAVAGTTMPTAPLEGFVRLHPLSTIETGFGQWIDGENMNGKKFLPGFKYCSICHKEAYWDSERGQQLFPCCPNCGARMESE